ncbi:MAG: RsmG family class I SAM-dependent methyltransferase, partial [Solirubrobacterales bacterium]
MSAARASAEPALEALLELLAEARAPISVASARRARDVHIADSLSGLEIESLASASRIADLGSGAGLPGLPLAA